MFGRAKCDADAVPGPCELAFCHPERRVGSVSCVATLIELLLIAGDDDLDAPPSPDRPARMARPSRVSRPFEVNFFPYRGESIAAAKVLRAVPVTAECLADALAHESTIGVWAGTSEIQRKRLRRARRHIAS